MRRLAATLVFLALALVARPTTALFTIDNSLLPSPAAVGANRVRVNVNAKGQAYASWVQENQLHFSALEPHRRRWAPAHVVPGSSVEVSSDENAAPQLAILTPPDGSTQLWAIWTSTESKDEPKAFWCVSVDGGGTWSPPTRLTIETKAQRYPALCVLADGRVLAVWTDERGLCGRVLSRKDTADTIVDPHPRGAPAVTAHPSAGAWVAYQRREQGQVHDIGLARFDGASWRRVNSLLLEHTPEPASPPSQAPAVASSASRLAVAWSLPHGREPRVQVSQAASADGPFLAPAQVHDAQPLGHPSLAILPDGTAFVCWLERYTGDEAALWLRRISPSGQLTVPVLLATAPSRTTVPRLALFKAPPNSPNQVLLAFTAASEAASQIVTRLVTLPPPSARASEKPCNCPDDLRAASGHALRGRIRSVDTSASALLIDHPEIPGALAAGTTRFKVDITVLPLASPDAEIVGKVEQQANDWWLFDARLIIRTYPAQLGPHE